MSDRKPLSAADAAKIISGKVGVLKLGEDGKPIMVPDEHGKPTGVFQTVERELTADDIISAADYGDRVVAVTIDGQKIEAKKPNAARSPGARS